MSEEIKDFVEIWKNHHAPKKNIKGLKIQSECHRFIDRHVIEIVVMEGFKIERLSIMYKVDNGKVSAG